MLTTFATQTASLSKDHLNEIFGYRHAVFVDKLGWDLPGAHDGIEMDQFDRIDTIHVGTRNEFGEICGYARLLPTTRSYLLSAIFPDLLGGNPLPNDEKVWEISRFSAVDLRKIDETRQFDFWVSKAVLVGCIKYALENGIERFITVSPLGIERLLRSAGVNARRAGPAMRLNGYALYACWIEVDEKTTSALGVTNTYAVA